MLDYTRIFKTNTCFQLWFVALTIKWIFKNVRDPLWIKMMEMFKLLKELINFKNKSISIFTVKTLGTIVPRRFFECSSHQNNAVFWVLMRPQSFPPPQRWNEAMKQWTEASKKSFVIICSRLPKENVILKREWLLFTLVYYKLL